MRKSGASSYIHHAYDQNKVVWLCSVLLAVSDDVTMCVFGKVESMERKNNIFFLLKKKKKKYSDAFSV